MQLERWGAHSPPGPQAQQYLVWSACCLCQVPKWCLTFQHNDCGLSLPLSLHIWYMIGCHIMPCYVILCSVHSIAYITDWIRLDLIIYHKWDIIYRIYHIICQSMCQSICHTVCHIIMSSYHIIMSSYHINMSSSHNVIYLTLYSNTSYILYHKLCLMCHV